MSTQVNTANNQGPATTRTTNDGHEEVDLLDTSSNVVVDDDTTRHDDAADGGVAETFEDEPDNKKNEEAVKDEKEKKKGGWFGRNKNKNKEEEEKKKNDNDDDDDDDDDEYDSDDDDEDDHRDYWGRKRTGNDICDCCRQCIGECCRGFCIPPGCEIRRLCTCPHGPCYTVMGVALGVGGLVMSIMYLLSCDIERVIIMYNGRVPENAPRIKYGFLARGPTYDETPDFMMCKWYTPEESAGLIDVWFKFSRLFLFLSTIVGIIGAVFLFMALCVAFTPHTFQHWLMWNYLFGAIFVPLTYLIFGGALCADNDCKLGEGGVQCISIFLFWLCAANTVKGFPEAPPPPREYDEDEEDGDSLYYENEEDMWNDRASDEEDEYDEEEEEFINNRGAPNQSSWLKSYKPPDTKPVGADLNDPYYDPNAGAHRGVQDDGYYNDDGQGGYYDQDGQYQPQQQDGYYDDGRPQQQGGYYDDGQQQQQPYYDDGYDDPNRRDDYLGGPGSQHSGVAAHHDDVQYGSARDVGHEYNYDGDDYQQRPVRGDYNYDENGGANTAAGHQDDAYYGTAPAVGHEYQAGGAQGEDDLYRHDIGTDAGHPDDAYYGGGAPQNLGHEGYYNDNQQRRHDDNQGPAYPQQNLPRVGEHDDGPTIT